MADEPMHGVYPILVTPYDEQGRIDVESLRSLVDFCLHARVHGLGIALGSEIVALSEDERSQVTRTVIDQVHGRVPVVVNSGGPVLELAVLYSRMAEEAGADALMVRPPTFMPAGPDQVVEYYRAISDAVQIPIFIQDTGLTPVGAGLALRIAEQCERVRYIKVESMPAPYQVGQAVCQAEGKLVVFGGAGGDYFIEEMRRGAVGTMPGCSQPEAFVEVWDAFQCGDERGAQQAFYRWILPVNRLTNQVPGAFYAVHKEILRRRGVIRTATVRGPILPLDETTQDELRALIDELYG